MSYTTLSTQEKPLFKKKFLYKTIFYSVHPFAHIQQHYFSKYWGGPMHGSSPTTNFWGSPAPQVSAPVRCLSLFLVFLFRLFLRLRLFLLLMFLLLLLVSYFSAFSFVSLT